MRISHAQDEWTTMRLWATTHWLTVVHGGRHSGAEPRDRESEIIVLAVFWKWWIACGKNQMCVRQEHRTY